MATDRPTWTPSREHPRKAGNVSAATVKEFWRRRQELDAKKGVIANEARALSRDMKGAGINVRMWNRACVEALRGVEDIALDQRDFNLYLAFMDKPLGFQSELNLLAISPDGAGAVYEDPIEDQDPAEPPLPFDAPPPGPRVGEALLMAAERVWEPGRLSEAARQRIAEAGEFNGVQASGRPQDNPWVPGSESHMLWAEGWRKGRLLHLRAAETKRRGRPPGSRDQIPRKRRGPRRKSAQTAQFPALP